MNETALPVEGDGRELLRRAEGLRERLVSLRLQLHARPEYGFCEHETARLVAATQVGLGAASDAQVRWLVAKISNAAAPGVGRAEGDGGRVTEES